MSRPSKEGLDYFNVDIDIWDDIKVLKAHEILDPTGNNNPLRLLADLVLLRLLANIYRNGYYLSWGEIESIVLSRKVFSTSDIIDKIIMSFVSSGFFDANMYRKFHILTSYGIQKRWVHVVKNARRKDSFIKEFKISRSEFPPKETEFLTEEIVKTHEETQSQGTETIQTVYTINDDNSNSLSNDTNSHNHNENPENSVRNPENSVRNPENSVRNPENSVRNPENSVRNPENSVRNPENSVIDHYEGNWHLPVELPRCLHYYWNHTFFSKSRGQAMEKLAYMHLDLPIEELTDLLLRWTKYFNKSLEAQALNAKQMQGKEGWPIHFLNWMGKKDLTLNPDRYDEEYQNKNHKKDNSKNGAESRNRPAGIVIAPGPKDYGKL